MKLSELLSQMTVPPGLPDPVIEGLSEDSRTVGKDFIFFARAGSKVSGLHYAQEAVRKGASAVITEEGIEGLSVPVVCVPSMAQAQVKIAEKFYDFPSRDLTIVGVTGTNGKTTFTYLLEAIAREMGWRTGVVGTINYRLPGKDSGVETMPAPNTTPNALELQKLLHAFRERKTDLVIMEVSSHALSLGRVDGIEFDGAVFTNLTQDHLDFHKTMDNYFEAKASLFSGMKTGIKVKRGFPAGKVHPDKFGIINSDDPYGEKMGQASSVPVNQYGIKTRSEFTAADIVLSPSGTRFKLDSPLGETPVKMRLIGQHNVYNALAAAACAVKIGVPLPKLVQGLENFECVPGRLEPVKCGQDFSVFVDYAHTEDALKNVMGILRQFAKKRLLTLFGCGGDRDRSKRPLMGAAAVQTSDWVVLTSDNPRSEDPRGIALDIEVGIHRTGRNNYEVIPDREKAIEKILKLAEKDDIVLLAGKGHETYQIFADRTIHFDDREVARKFLTA